MSGPCDILLHMAMLAEARPVAARLGLEPAGTLDPAIPAQLWRSETRPGVCLVTHGIDPAFACDRIGTETATLVAHLAVRATRPRLVVNAGTCGGFESRGTRIGTVCVPSRFLFHDQRVPLPRFGDFATCRIDADAALEEGGVSAPRGDLRSAASIAQRTRAVRGTLSTGSSLDATAHELDMFAREAVVAKDMEGAAVARVCRDLRTPMVAIKAVTDHVDHGADTAAEFVRNLAQATAALADAVSAALEPLAPRAQHD